MDTLYIGVLDTPKEFRVVSDTKVITSPTVGYDEEGLIYLLKEVPLKRSQWYALLNNATSWTMELVTAECFGRFRCNYFRVYKIDTKLIEAKYPASMSDKIEAVKETLLKIRNHIKWYVFKIKFEALSVQRTIMRKVRGQ